MQIDHKGDVERYINVPQYEISNPAYVEEVISDKVCHDHHHHHAFRCFQGQHGSGRPTWFKLSGLSQKTCDFDEALPASPRAVYTPNTYLQIYNVALDQD